VATTSGFRVVPGHDLNRLAEADLILVVAAAPPGTSPPAELIAGLRAAVERGATVASLCTGAFVLAEAGLLDGRRATTRWMHAARLADEYPGITVEVDRLYVEDGPVITGVGCAASSICAYT
jgi:AraC family transcriptional activator FtrA